MYHVIVPKEKKEEMDKKVRLMQNHPQPIQLNKKIKGKKTKSIEKSYIEKDDVIYLSSHVARWQLLGVIRTMKAMMIEVDDSSRTASEVGLENGVYNVMIYDSMVCRRGIWRPNAFKMFCEEKLKEHGITKCGEKLIYQFLDRLLCFYPVTGVQIDYTAGLIIQEEAIPEKAKEWLTHEASWPTKDLKDKVMNRGAHLVPKVFKNAANTKETRARQWRINFDINLIIFDSQYAENIDVRRILIILKDLKNGFLRTSMMKSYHIKVAIAFVMYDKQDERSTFSTRSMLLAVLVFLKDAYKDVKLPDFFNRNFNHLHSNQEKKYDFELLSQNIGNIIECFDEHLEKLVKMKEIFKQSQTDFINRKLKNLAGMGKDIGLNATSIFDSLKTAFPGMNSASKMNLEDFISWTAKSDYMTGMPILRELSIHEDAKDWRVLLKERYKKLFDMNDVLTENDYNENRRKDNLSESILKNFLEHHENFETTKEKFQIWCEIEKVLQEELDCAIFAFGSSFTLCSIKGSDLDLMVYLSKEYDSLEILNHVQRLLVSSNLIQRNTTLIEAKIPVFKCVHSRTRINIDIIIATGKDSNARIRCAHLFYHYAICDWRFRPLIVAFKVWASKMKINDPTKHSLSSHTLTIMAIHYLTTGINPPILHNFLQEYPKKFGRDLDMTQISFHPKLRSGRDGNETRLSELFLGLISYFANFDPKRYGLSIGKKCGRLDSDMHLTRDFSTKYQYFLVQDPYDLNNAARAVSSVKDLKFILSAFDVSSKIGNINHQTFEKFCTESVAQQILQEEKIFKKEVAIATTPIKLRPLPSLENTTLYRELDLDESELSEDQETLEDLLAEYFPDYLYSLDSLMNDIIDNQLYDISSFQDTFFNDYY